MRPSLFFVTPAWQRFELTRLCLEQRRDACDRLAAVGIDATCVIVADDENLDIARELGFETVESPNDWLSRRFNDGYQHAARHGADFVCPIGSDSWIDAELLAELPPPGIMQVSRNYAVVREDGRVLAELAMRTPYGFGCFVIPTPMLERFGYRPCKERLQSGCDGSLFTALFKRTVPRVKIREIGPLDIVAFRSPIQITPYERLVTRHRGTERRRPFRLLLSRYPARLVDAAEQFHLERMAAA